MIEKRRCPNCGAYLTENDATCYVCGEVIGVPNVQPREHKPNQKTYAPVFYEPEADEDFVTPVDFDEADGRSFEERAANYDNDMVTGKTDADFAPADYEDDFVTGNTEEERLKEKYKDFSDFDPYEDYEEYKRKGSGKGKKALIITAIVVAVLGLGAVVAAFLFANGILGGKPVEEYTVYFDKPSVNLILRDSDGKGYSWGSDVSVCYSIDNREDNVNCTVFAEYDNMWQCKIPVGATDIYFYQNSGEKLRTDALSQVEDKNVYYVTDITLSSRGTLPVAHCHIDEFNNFGVNATQATSVTKETTKATKATESKTEKTTETESATEETSKSYEGTGYELRLPSTWESGATAVKKSNCTTYYEKYNYSKYGSGMLLSIYVFDEGDNSYGDLNVKKVFTVSDGRKVVVVTPTDVEFDDEDETAAEKYIALSNLTDEVIASISVK